MIMQTTWLICSNPLITQEKTVMENPGPLQELWNKKVHITSRKFRTYEENLFMEQNGDRRPVGFCRNPSIAINLS